MPLVNAAIHTISALVACLSIFILGLVAHSVFLKARLEYTATPDLNSTGMSFLFWPACGGIVDCFLFLFLWTQTPFHEAQSKKITIYLNALIFVAAFYFMRPFIVLVYTVVEHDVETWACLLSNHGSNGSADSLCKELRAARYLLIPLLVLGMAFLSFVIWQRLGVWKRTSDRARDTPGEARGGPV